MITTHFEGLGGIAEGADRTALDPKRQTLIYAVKIQSGIADPHKFVVAGEAIPALIRLLEGVVAQYPALTTERAKEGDTHLSGGVKLSDLPKGKES